MNNFTTKLSSFESYFFFVFKNNAKQKILRVNKNSNFNERKVAKEFLWKNGLQIAPSNKNQQKL